MENTKQIATFIKNLLLSKGFGNGCDIQIDESGYTTKVKLIFDGVVDAMYSIHRRKVLISLERVEAEDALDLIQIQQQAQDLADCLKN